MCVCVCVCVRMCVCIYTLFSFQLKDELKITSNRPTESDKSDYGQSPPLRSIILSNGLRDRRLRWKIGCKIGKTCVG